MDNKLMDESVGDLLMAAYRKTTILKLASIGAPIDQDKVDILCGLLGHSNAINTVIDKELNRVVTSILDMPVVKEESQYIVVFTEYSTRDTQVANCIDAQSNDEEGWMDFGKAEVIAGIYKATSKEDAINQAAISAEVDIAVLKSYEIVKEIDNE